MRKNGWIGVDFDGTLAVYGTWVAADHCGEPIPPMVKRVKKWLAEGWEVRIFTARMWPIVSCIRPEDPITFEHSRPETFARRNDALKSVVAIRRWCLQNIGQVLPITCVKDMGMIELWDDRAIQVRPNTGQVVGKSRLDTEDEE